MIKKPAGQTLRNPFTRHASSKPAAHRYAINMRVVHVTYGAGTVINVQQNTVRVRFDDRSRGIKEIEKSNKDLMPREAAMQKANLRRM